MPLSAGKKLGTCEILAPLGAGGMGEVYLAHDRELHRTVALKLLHAELSCREQLMRRFIQEARTASALNHPNIITIHEIGQMGERYYIAMEYVEGETLGSHIHRDQTGLPKLLKYLQQVAEGLTKAHAAGIVHRDLKPDNIMITRDGYAKILDFGLAKLVEQPQRPGTTEPSEANTAVMAPTSIPGMVMGTLGYMSPEQAQGKSGEIDHRSDIFSFGCILYEVATKQRPFVADSDVDVMHKILHDKPQPIDEINPSVPAELRRMIRRCMAKDPDKRYQSMKDLALELGEIVDDFEELSASATSASRSVSGDALQMPGRRTQWTIIAATLVALVAIGFAAYVWRQAHATVKPPAAYNSMEVTRLTSSGTVSSAAVSPDGKYLAYVTGENGKWALMVRQITTGTDVPVVTAAINFIPDVTFSPDGDYLYYVQRENSGPGYQLLYRVPALGGQPRKIAFDVDTAPGFSPDGKQMAWGRGYPQLGQNGLIVASIDGTGERELIRTERLGDEPISPSWAPDGKKIIDASRTLKGGVHSEILEVDVATAKVRQIGPRWHSVLSAKMLADGTGIVAIAFQSASFRPQIWIQPYPDGSPVRVTNDVAEYLTASPTPDGKTLAAIVGSANFNLTVADLGDETGGKPLTTGTGDQVPFHLFVAPKNGAVVYAFDRADGTNIAMIDAPGAAPRILTTDGVSDNPTIAENHTIAFRSRAHGSVPTISVMDADGGNVRKIAEGDRAVISPDARFVAYYASDASLFVVPTAGGTPRKITDNANGAFAFDPTSTRLAYTYWRKEGAGRNVARMRIISLDGTGTPIDLRPPEGAIRWTPKGDAITFIVDARPADNIFAMPLDGGQPKQLTHFRHGEILSADWTPDGKLVMARGENPTDMVLIRNFR